LLDVTSPWLLPLLAVAALLIYLFSGSREQVAQQPVTAAPSLMVNGVDVGKQVNDSITSLRASLANVTDAASAQAACRRCRKAGRRQGLLAKDIERRPGNPLLLRHVIREGNGSG
jgi:hypothetical protein